MEAITLTLDDARQFADRCAVLLRERFGVQRVILFGSAAGTAPWHDRSDLDLAVEGLRAEDQLRALNACLELLPPGLSLDLIPLESVWPELRALIEGEMEMPQDTLEALRFEIETELRHLSRLVQRATDFLKRAPAEPDEILVQGCGKYLHDFYNGVERICERIAVRLDEDLPAGPNWHTLLLQRMGQTYGSRRPAAIDRKLETTLSAYLRFRHLYRHTYGYDLEWQPVRELSQGLPAAFDALQGQVLGLLSALKAE